MFPEFQPQFPKIHSLIISYLSSSITIFRNYRLFNITKFFITDWHGKKHFRFYSSLTDVMNEYNNRDYWIFTDVSALGNSGTNYYEFIEGIGEIFVEGWGGNYLLDEIHYFKTSSDEWGTPFTHSCSDNTGLSETQVAQISIYPNPALDILHIQSSELLEHIFIYDVQGRLVKQYGQRISARLNISDLENGLYILQFQTKEGFITQRKFQKL